MSTDTDWLDKILENLTEQTSLRMFNMKLAPEITAIEIQELEIEAKAAILHHESEAVKAARIDGMNQAKSRVLKRTEIPKDAREPTRDAIVILGEEIADIIQRDIKQLQGDSTHKNRGPGFTHFVGDDCRSTGATPHFIGNHTSGNDLAGSNPEAKSKPIESAQSPKDNQIDTIEQILDKHAEYYIKETMKFFQEVGESPTLSRNKQRVEQRQALSKIRKEIL